MKAKLILALTMITCLGRTVAAQGLSAEEMRKIGYDQHIGQTISHNLVFQDSNKRTVALGDLLNTKPTLLVPGYYHCPMLCTLVNDGMIEALQQLRFDVGRDFNVINFSIDPHETPEVAAVKKKEYLKRYGRPNTAEGWHFLTGSEEAIAQLTNETGFRFKYDPATHEYAHPSGFVVLTPEGKISRYFFGVNFEAKELRSAIIAASNGQNGSIVHELVLLCSHYNPITGKYGALVLGVLRGLGVLTVLAMVWWIVSMCRRPARAEGVEAR